jgi:hypothetical protein
VKKSPGSGKSQKMNGVANKGLATKSTPNQPNAMEAWFVHLEALMTSMTSSMAT